MPNSRTFHEGDIVQHFKHETVDPTSNKYLYEIIGEATHTENNETLMIYKSVTDGRIYARPYDMFIGEVDHEKYPNIKQKYRMEIFNESNNT